MTPVTYRLEDLKNATIELGFVGENEHRMIRFDSTKLFDEYPDAVVALTVVAPSGEAYPAVAGRDGNFVSWVVTDSDLVKDGSGELQLTFIEGNAVAKTYRARTKVYGSIEATGEAPTPVEQWMIAANAALNGIPVTVQNALAEAKASGMFDGEDGVGIVSISKTSTSGKVDTYTVTLSDGTTYPITVTNGEDGTPGAPGYTPRKGIDYFDGQDGYTPVKGVDYFDGQDGVDGVDGEDGLDGVDGVSPTVTVTDITGGHRVVITDAEGDHQFDVMDGESADAPVQDVQINGTSILDDGVANLPVASGTDLGVVKVGSGLTLGNDNKLKTQLASDSYLKGGDDANRVIVPYNQHTSVFYGLAKVAGVDLANETVTVGAYPASARTAIKRMLKPRGELIADYTVPESVASVTVDVDSYGNPFQLEKVKVIVKLPASTTGAKTYYLASWITEDEATGNTTPYGCVTIQTASANADMFFYEAEAYGGFVFYSRGYRASSFNSSSSNIASYCQNFSPKFVKGFTISQYNSSTSLVPAGTEILIYGVRY